MKTCRKAFVEDMIMTKILRKLMYKHVVEVFFPTVWPRFFASSIFE